MLLTMQIIPLRVFYQLLLASVNLVALMNGWFTIIIFFQIAVHAIFIIKTPGAVVLNSRKNDWLAFNATKQSQGAMPHCAFLPMAG
ncbi:MAG: hypothetical protein PHX02_00320 [Oscillospiraceae bacterium]|jgi:hypothetical protein|nr:hypothetical protein [Oscillospiraceae bacterium]